MSLIWEQSAKIKTKQDVFAKYYAPGNKVQKDDLSIKDAVKVAKSLTLMSFERKSFVEFRITHIPEFHQCHCYAFIL